MAEAGFMESRQPEPSPRRGDDDRQHSGDHYPKRKKSSFLSEMFD